MFADGNRLTTDLMVEACREPVDEHEKDSPAPSVFKAVEALCKGIEVALPDDHKFSDKDGHSRSSVRTRWWDKSATSYRLAAMLDGAAREALPEDQLPDHVRIGHDGGTPVFFGHYWLTGTPGLLSDKLACVDYSIAKGGKLVAYRWDGEPVLDASRFHWVGK